MRATEEKETFFNFTGHERFNITARGGIKKKNIWISAKWALDQWKANILTQSWNTPNNFVGDNDEKGEEKLSGCIIQAWEIRWTIGGELIEGMKVDDARGGASGVYSRGLSSPTERMNVREKRRELRTNGQAEDDWGWYLSSTRFDNSKFCEKGARKKNTSREKNIGKAIGSTHFFSQPHAIEIEPFPKKLKR